MPQAFDLGRQRRQACRLLEQLQVGQGDGRGQRIAGVSVAMIESPACLRPAQEGGVDLVASSAWRPAAGNRRSSPLARQRKSGATSSCSQANIVPVRPKPTATSSAISSTSCRRVTSRTPPQIALRGHDHARRSLHQRFDHDGRQLIGVPAHQLLRVPRSAIDLAACALQAQRAAIAVGGWAPARSGTAAGRTGRESAPMPPTLTSPRVSP